MSLERGIVTVAIAPQFNGIKLHMLMYLVVRNLEMTQWGRLVPDAQSLRLQLRKLKGRASNLVAQGHNHLVIPLLVYQVPRLGLQCLNVTSPCLQISSLA